MWCVHRWGVSSLGRNTLILLSSFPSCSFFFSASWHVSHFGILLSQDKCQITWCSIFILSTLNETAYNIKVEAHHTHQQKRKKKNWRRPIICFLWSSPANNYPGYMQAFKVRFELIRRLNPQNEETFFKCSFEPISSEINLIIDFYAWCIFREPTWTAIVYLWEG